MAEDSNAGAAFRVDAVEITDSPSPSARLSELGLPKSELVGITILPRDLFAASGKKDLVYEDSAWDVRTALRAQGIDVNFLIEPVRTIQENKFEWLLPALHIAKDVVDTADGLTHLTNGLKRIYSLARHRSGVKVPIRLSVVTEDGNGKTKRLTLRANNAADIEMLSDTIVKVLNEVS